MKKKKNLNSDPFEGFEIVFLDRTVADEIRAFIESLLDFSRRISYLHKRVKLNHRELVRISHIQLTVSEYVAFYAEMLKFESNYELTMKAEKICDGMDEVEGEMNGFAEELEIYNSGPIRSDKFLHISKEYDC